MDAGCVAFCICFVCVGYLVCYRCLALLTWLIIRGGLGVVLCLMRFVVICVPLLVCLGWVFTRVVLLLIGGYFGLGCVVGVYLVFA